MSSRPADGSMGGSLPPLAPGPYRRRLGVVALVATFGGLLFGYDTSVINGAMELMSKPDQLDLDALGEGVAVSSLLFAAALGAISGGRLSDAWGRRKTIILLAAMFFCGVIFCVASPNLEVMVVGRVILGLAVGAASTVVPVFLAELAPYEIRGSIAGRNEMMIVTGQLTAIVINAIIGNVWGEQYHWIWRVMLMFAAIPAVALFFGMLRMPESPRWLVEKGRKDEALEILDRLRPPGRAKPELEDIARVASDEASLTRMDLQGILSNKNLFRILLVGCGLGFFQQLTGINSILYYGQKVLIDSGFSAGGALIANIAPAVISVITAIIALRMMDRFSRRKTFLMGYALVTVSHVLIGLASVLIPDGSAIKPYILLVFIVFFVGSMGLFLNVATWVTLSEIFPLKMRAFGMGMSVFVLWLTNSFLGLFFPTVIQAIGISGSFFAFAALNLVAFLFVYRAVPETRGRTLEQLEEDVTTGAIYTITKSQRMNARS